MISLRLAIPAVLTAAAVAWCITYFVTLPPVPNETGPLLRPTVPNSSGRPDTSASTSTDQPLSTAQEKTAAAYREAAEAILRRIPDIRASAGADELPITGRVPLPKRRPVTAP
jgi:hypothetical protein